VSHKTGARGLIVPLVLNELQQLGLVEAMLVALHHWPAVLGQE
jgi:hypothetical protein